MRLGGSGGDLAEDVFSLVIFGWKVPNIVLS